MTQTAAERPPRVTVGMSCYNKAAFLRETIPTVLNQTFADFEFIIWDNCSTDDSVSIIKEFNDPRIRFFQNTRNIGPVASPNNCIEKARGEFFVFFHGDDLWQENFLETNIRYLDQIGTANVSHSPMHAVDEDGVRSERFSNKGAGPYELTGYQDVLKRLFKSGYVQTPTVVYRRSVMPYYDYRYSYVCDWDMYLQLAAAKNDFLFINEPLMYYRSSAGSETNVGVRGGGLIIECYLVLRNFFNGHPEHRGHSRKSYKRLSDATLRRSRSAESREHAYFLMGSAILFYPLNALSPVFHCYLLLGLLFGPAGLRLLKSRKKGGKK
uniref:Glycosyl transferase family 2 n=1 Tax=Geobacter sp. (strain M21) TaxID=443144 RepID=C6E5A8_GEOSM